MSQSQSYSYSSSTSYSSTTTSDGQTHSKSQTTRSSYNDQDGGHHERVTTETGKPTVVETRREPGSVEHAGADAGAGQARIEDVTDQEADERYREAIEDEYAKREGGA